MEVLATRHVFLIVNCNYPACAAHNLLLDFGHPQVVFGLVVGERDRFIIHEPQDVALEVSEALHLSGGSCLSCLFGLFLQGVGTRFQLLAAGLGNVSGSAPIRLMFLP